MVKLNRAFFLDRDGVILKPIINNGKPVAPRSLNKIKIIKNVKKSLQILKKNKFINIIITNQPDVRDGLIAKLTIKKMHQVIKKKLKIDDIYTCFHNDEDNCKCRKPKRGLIFKAKKKWNIDLKKSYIIGDRWRDIELANKLKMKCFYIDYNYNEKKPKKYNYKVKSLLTAVRKLKTNEK